jgi:hypothetical protein
LPPEQSRRGSATTGQDRIDQSNRRQGHPGTRINARPWPCPPVLATLSGPAEIPDLRP